jgi:hypothetical protein
MFEVKDEKALLEMIEAMEREGRRFVAIDDIMTCNAAKVIEDMALAGVRELEWIPFGHSGYLVREAARPTLAPADLRRHLLSCCG